jgi:hypothetical protein
MGWTFSSNWKTTDDVAASLHRDMTWSGNYRVVDSAQTREGGYTVLWTVVERITPASGGSLDVGQRTILCELMEWDREVRQWGAKSLDESSEPYYWSCPAKLLRLAEAAGPAPTPAAAKWRGQCHAQRATKAAETKARKAWFVPGGQCSLAQGCSIGLSSLAGMTVSIVSTSPLVVNVPGVGLMRAKRTQLVPPAA